MVAGLPGIGQKLAKEILKQCKTFDGFYTDLHNNMEILDEIKGLSKKGRILSSALAEMRRRH